MRRREGGGGGEGDAAGGGGEAELEGGEEVAIEEEVVRVDAKDGGRCNMLYNIPTDSPPPRGVCTSHGSRTAAVAARTSTSHTCRCHGLCEVCPCAWFADITPLVSDRFRGGEAMSQAQACSRRRMSGRYAFH